MSKKKAVESPFSQFFREDSQGILKESGQQGNELIFDKTPPPPFIPESIAVDDEVVKTEWKKLRKFFVSSLEGGLPEDSLPLHLNPSITFHNTLLHYPVWISQNTGKETAGCKSLISLLSDAINELYPEPSQGKIIKEVFSRIVMEADEILRSKGVSDFMMVLDQATNTLRNKMEIKGSEEELFDTQIQELKAKIRSEGLLIPYSSNSAFNLLDAVLFNVTDKAKTMLSARINSILPTLKDILTVEEENNPESADPEHLKSSMGFADNFLDFDKLSSVIPDSASEHLSNDRIERIKDVIKVLDGDIAFLKTKATIVVQNKLNSKDKKRWEEIIRGSEVIEAAKNKACQSTIIGYNQRIKDFTDVIKAIRIGSLEIENKYTRDLHDDFFAAFDLNFITEEEMSFLPPSILIADAARLIAEELNDFSVMLHKGIPIKIIALKSIGSNSPQNLIDPVSLVVSVRNTYVSQSTCLNPQSLFQRFEEGISSLSPSFFHVEIAESGNYQGQFMELSASMEGRNFPQFVYNGKMGTAWGSRFDIDENPQGEKDWPIYEYEFQNSEAAKEKIQLPFTFADFLALNDANASEFRVVEPEYWTEDLVNFADYLHLTDKEKYGKIPIIWMTGEENRIMKVAVSWNVVLAANEKLDFWFYLQDCGGINSFHAQRAVKLQENIIRKEGENQINELKQKHIAELEQVKKESTEDAMEHLTSALLDLDSSDILSAPSSKSSPQEDTSIAKLDSESNKEESSEDTQSPTIEEEPELITEEAWIETPLCTNCNECTDINARMFNYNADKLAFIADPQAGTYAQMVEAAEKCPVKIIHPGKPLNPDEPGLEDLISRAAKFN